MQKESIIIGSYCESALKVLQDNVSNQLKIEFEPYCADNSAFVQEIGVQLGKLKDLIELSLIFNQSTNLKQESWKYVFQGLEQLKQLQKLEIIIGESCSLEEQGLNLLSYAISSLTCLKKLIIVINKSNYVSALSLKNLVDNFKYFSQIEELKLQVQEYQIDISEDKLNLWQGLSFLQSIQDLDLSLNLQYNSEQDIKDIFQALLSFNNLTKLTLNLDYNYQGYNFLKILTLYLSKLIQLKELSLALNQKVKEKEDIFLIDTFFRNLINLEKINLESCFGMFLNRPLDDYYESLACLPNITDLKIIIESNNSTDSDRKVAQCLSNKQKLKSLKLFCYKENIHDQIYNEIMQSLKQNSSIQTLDLAFSNFIKQSQGIALCESLNHMSELKQLNFTTDLTSNKIDILNQILESIGKIQSLKELDLHFKTVNVFTDRKQELALSHLGQLKLLSLSINIESMLFSNEFLELGMALQRQNDLQKLKILIRFQEKKKQGFGFGFQASQQQPPEENNEIESIEDFINGINTLTNLKELHYGIAHDSTRIILNQILQSLQNLKNLEVFNLYNNEKYEGSQMVQLSEAISFMKKLKILNYQSLFWQKTIQKQIQQFQTLQNLEQLFLNIDCNYLNKSIVGLEQMFSNLFQLKTAHLKVFITKDNQSLLQDLFKGLQNLRNLQDLQINLGNYEFTDKGADLFHQACSGLENLREMFFENFNIKRDFTEEGIQSFRDGFSKLRKLKFLTVFLNVPCIEINQIIQGIFSNIYLCAVYLNFQMKAEFDFNSIKIEKPIKEKSIVESKNRNKSNLTNLQLSFRYAQQCQVDDFMKFYEKFEDFENLNSLTISHDWDISQNSSQFIECTKMFVNFYRSFKQFRKMKELKIELTNSSYNFEEIPIQNMKYLTNLAKLELILLKNNIHSYHLLFDQLEYFIHLQYLKIQISEETPFSKTAAISLGQSLTKLKKLLTLDLQLLQNCTIEIEGAIQIGTGIGYLNYLQSLKIYFGDLCEINEIGALKIAEGISKISTLNYLSLDIGQKNKVSKKAGAALASSIKNSKNLTDLFFQIQYDNTNYQGQQFLNEISKSLSELKQIKQLMLSISFDENLEYCPEQLKQFISFTCTKEVTLVIENEYQQQKTYLKSEDSACNIQFIFQYDLPQPVFFAKVEIESLQNVSKDIQLAKFSEVG